MADEQAAAATKIQAIQKGKSARKIRQQQIEAATKVQAVSRGRSQRLKFDELHSGGGGPTAYERRQAAAARVKAAAEPKTLAQLGLKSGLPINPVPGLRFLTFYSWWHESGTKRYMEICFDLQTELFQLTLDKMVSQLDISKHESNPLAESYAGVTAQDTKVMSMHLHEKLSGNQHAESLRRPHLQGWDLHVGCKLNVLGRPTTLMQCNLLTGKWLDYHAERLGRIKGVLDSALRKYETVPVLAAIAGKKGKPRAQGAADLRLLLNQIDAIQLRLGRYRPNHAAQLAMLSQSV